MVSESDRDRDYHQQPITSNAVPSTIEAIRSRFAKQIPRPATVLQGCTCEECQTSLYHHPAHSRDQPRAYRLRGPGFRAHETWLLASRAVASFPCDTPYSWGQMKALIDWKAWWPTAKAGSLCSLDLSSVPISRLRKPVEIFNQLFFLGALPNSRLRLLWEPQPTMTHGWTCQPDSDAGCSTIALNPNMRLHILSPRAVLCTLLHEMIHAYLGRYSCRGITCGSLICSELSRQNIGQSGHGRAWQYMAKAIEERLSDLLDFKGRLGREECAFAEITNIGFRPSVCDAKRLFPTFSARLACMMPKAMDDNIIMRGVIGVAKFWKRRPREADGRVRRWSI